MLGPRPTPLDAPLGYNSPLVQPTHKRGPEHSASGNHDRPAKQLCNRMDRADQLLMSRDRRSSITSSSIGAAPPPIERRTSSAQRALDLGDNHCSLSRQPSASAHRGPPAPAADAADARGAAATDYGAQARPLDGAVPLLKRADYSDQRRWWAACAQHLLAHKHDWVSYKAQKAPGAVDPKVETHLDFKHPADAQMAVWFDSRAVASNLLQDIKAADDRDEIPLAPR